MERYEVVLEDAEGNITNWGPGEALDEGHAADLARESNPELSVVEVMLVED